MRLMQEMEENKFVFRAVWSEQFSQMTLMVLVGGLPLYIVSNVFKI